MSNVQTEVRNNCASTILELLDALEACMVNQRDRRAALNEGSLSPEALSVRMQDTGITASDFTTFFGLHPGMVEDWLAGRTAIPCWVQPCLQIYELLPPAARRRLFQRPQALSRKRTLKPHPFSKIEEL